MSNRIENVETKNAPSWVLDIMSHYFLNNYRLTVGTMIRKLPFMLIELATHNSKPWYLTCKYDTKSGGRFISRITCPDDTVPIVEKGRTIGSSAISLTAINLVSEGALYDNTLAVLNQAFESDKWVTMPVSEAKVRLVVDNRAYVYHKILHAADELGNKTYCFAVYPEKVNIFKSIYFKLKDFIDKKAKSRIVISAFNVLDAKYV